MQPGEEEDLITTVECSIQLQDAEALVEFGNDNSTSSARSMKGT
jgi:hypothetical protein